MSPLVKKLKERLLPEFEEVAESIHRKIPNVRVDVYSTETSQLKSQDFWIDCVLTDDYDEVDNVALGVNLYLETTLKINADICW